MKKFPWRYLLVILVIILLSLVVFFWRKKKLNQPIALPKSSETVETLSYAVNDFPLENLGETGFESYRLNCRFEQINLYPNYYDAPILPGNWRLLADILCQYTNSEGNLESLYLPLHIYQADREELLLVGTDIKTTSEDLAIQLAEKTVLGWYEVMIEAFWKAELEPHKLIKVIANFPSDKLTGNQTRGAAFETVNGLNPPYTQEDLTNFYATGKVQYLPEINNKHYFWPVVGYSF